MAGERLNLTNQPPHPPVEKSNARPYLGVRFQCCDMYLRIYRNRDETAYEGRCPRCGKPVKVKIQPGGTAARFFEVR